MEVAPAVLPHLGALGPASVRAGEQHLEGLGEGGLARAVAADHQGQAGGGLQGEHDRRADASKALDVDGREVGRGGGLVRLRGRDGGRFLTVQSGPERVRPLEGCEDQASGALDARGRLGEPGAHQVLESWVSHLAGESGRGCGRRTIAGSAPPPCVDVVDGRGPAGLDPSGLSRLTYSCRVGALSGRIRRTRNR